MVLYFIFANFNSGFKNTFENEEKSSYILLYIFYLIPLIHANTRELRITFNESIKSNRND